MRPIATDVVWCVCLCVLDVLVSPIQNAWTNQDAVWGVDSWGPERAMYWVGPCSAAGRGTFRGVILGHDQTYPQSIYSALFASASAMRPLALPLTQDSTSSFRCRCCFSKPGVSHSGHAASAINSFHSVLSLLLLLPLLLLMWCRRDVTASRLLSVTVPLSLAHDEKRFQLRQVTTEFFS